MRLLRAYLLLLLGICEVLAASAQSYSPPSGPLYQLYFAKQAYFDSIHAFTPDSLFYHEGGEYAEFQKFFRTWEPRLAPHGDMEVYDQLMRNYNDRQAHGAGGSSFRSDDEDPWLEIGPTRRSGGILGIGPIRNIIISDVSPLHMLCTSASGGLFYTTDGAENWQNAGTDTHWTHSGCSSAAYYPNTTSQWFAVSSYGGRISYVGGVFRTTNGPDNWDPVPIANYANLDGPGTTINKLLFDSKTTGNDHRLFIAADNGLYYCDNPVATAPAWNSVTIIVPADVANAHPTGTVNPNVRFYDIEYLPDNPQSPNSTLCASVMFTVDNGTAGTAKIWRFMLSSDNGINWDEIANQPIIDESIGFATVETSAAAPNAFYCLALTTPSSWVKAYDVTPNGTGWTNMASGFSTAYGAGNGFGVDPSDANSVFVSNYTGLAWFHNGSYSGVSNSHADVEDIIGSPDQPNVMWVANHGGVNKVTLSSSSSSYEDKSDGLGVAEVWSMSTSQNKPDYVALGLFHDGEILTQTPYTEGWNPDWGFLQGGDGTLVIVNNKDANGVYCADQYYLGASRWKRFDNAESGVNQSNESWSLHTQYYSKGALNRNTPDHLYRTNQISLQGEPPDNLTTNYENEIWRSFDRGHTEELISDFTHNFNLTRRAIGNYTFDNEQIWWIRSNPANTNHLYVGMLNWDWQTRIMRNTNVENPNSQNVITSWEEIPHPRRVQLYSDNEHRQAQVLDIAFDSEDENSVYIAYSTSHFANPVDNIGPYADQMIFRLDVSDLSLYPDPGEYPFECGSGIPCSDLTMNLPNTIADEDALCYEQGSDGGIYFATEVGVYFTNNKRINAFDPDAPENADDFDNTTGWVRVGDALPHVTAHGLEINYQVNRIRAGLIGRGVWEHHLHCPDDWGYSETGVYAGGKFLEAMNDISSEAVIPTGLKVSYRAGNEVHLTPGFHNASGARFHAFIHPCDAPGNSMHPKSMMVDMSMQDDDEVPRPVGLEIFPNPTDGMLTIQTTYINRTETSNIRFYDTTGKLSLSTMMNGNIFNLDVSRLHGLYMVVVECHGVQYSRRIIIQ